MINKINNLYNSSVNNNIVVKTVDGMEKNMTLQEFNQLNINFSGFILHNNQKNYTYEQIADIAKNKNLKNYSINFYHLPIESKSQFIIFVIKYALELIKDETGIKRKNPFKFR